MTVQQALELVGRVGPVLVFFLAITIVAEIADVAGVFDVAGHWAARAARHRTTALWLLFVLLACGCTIVLSLDTTAVLLTPVGLAIARQTGISSVPFAMATLWLANTASLLLPVSNLTNLLALHRFDQLGLGHAGYVAHAWAPALAAILGTLVVLWLLNRRALRGRYAPDPPAAVQDQVLLHVAGAVCIALGPLFAAGLTPAIVSSVAAAVLVLTVLARDRSTLRGIAVPWKMALAFAVLFFVVDVALRHGLSTLLAAALGTGTTAPDLARVTGVAALGANAINNLPAYLALEPGAASDPHRLLALLIGVNVGPLVTMWASLATLLWAQRCRAAGVRIPPGRLAWQGLICAVVSGGAALFALTLR